MKTACMDPIKGLRGPSLHPEDLGHLSSLEMNALQIEGSVQSLKKMTS